MSSSVSSLEQLYNDLSIQNSPKPDTVQQEQFMDPFTSPVAPVAPASPQPVQSVDASVAPTNPFRMPQPLQPEIPATQSPVLSRQQDNPVTLVQMYMDRMTKMMVAMDDRLTRLESLMSHNLFLLHQQNQQPQAQKQPKNTQEEDLEKALKEQVQHEIAQARKMQAQFEQDGEIAKKIQAQMDEEYFSEERKKFYTQPQPSLAPRPAARPRQPGFEECPVCLGQFKQNELEAHVYACLDGDQNMDANGKPKVVDKPSFLARLFGGKKEVAEEKAPLMTSAHPMGGMEYPGHPGGIYPGISYPPPMYPMPSSPYMHPSQPTPFYYYVPQPHTA
jgi:hypothetical protein